MQEQATVEELKRLPSVGETTAQTLQNKGYGTFESLATSNPMELHKECNIVLSSATHIISAAVEQIDGECPDCGSNNLNNEWQEYTDSIPNKNQVEIVCNRCGWFGEIDNLN